MSEKKKVMTVTIACDDKEEMKSVLNSLKELVATAVPGATMEDPDDKEPEAFRPKKGDICTLIEDDEPTAIFRFNGKERIDEDGCRQLDSDFSLGYSGNILQPYIVVKGDDQECPADDCRLATEEEIKLFQAFVEVYEKKEKDAAWVPKDGDKYFFPHLKLGPGTFRPETMFWDGVCFEVEMSKIGWVFPTEKECQQFCDRLNEAIKNIKP